MTLPFHLTRAPRTLSRRRGFLQSTLTTGAPLSCGRGAGGEGMAKRIIGLTPEECLAKAESMFREMDLQWDLAELEKVRTQLR